MNPLIQQFLGAVIRWLLTFIGTWMVEHGILTADEMPSMVMGFSLLLVTLGWSLYQKWKSKREAFTLGALKQGATLQDAKESIKQGCAASAMTGVDEAPTLKAASKP